MRLDRDPNEMKLEIEQLRRDCQLYYALALDYAWAILCVTRCCDANENCKILCQEEFVCGAIVQQMLRDHEMPDGYVERIDAQLLALEKAHQWEPPPREDG